MSLEMNYKNEKTEEDMNIINITDEIDKRQDHRRKTIQKATLSENDVDQLKGNMMDFLWGSISSFCFVIAMFPIFCIIITIGTGITGHEDFRPMLVITAFYVIVSAALILYYVLSYHSFYKHLSESDELALMVNDFTYGKKYDEYNLILGQVYLFKKGSNRIYKYDDIAEIYHEWDDPPRSRGSYWKLCFRTVDKKNHYLTNLSFKRSKENYFNKVLPLILEIRSRNPDIVIRPLSYRSFYKHLSESDELALMVNDFTYGEKYYEYGLILGQVYLFKEGSNRIYKYDDIAEIYHEWADPPRSRGSYWKLCFRTVDKKNHYLTNLSFKRSKENYFNKVLPLILEIRSRNPDIVIRPLRSFWQ